MPWWRSALHPTTATSCSCAPPSGGRARVNRILLDALLRTRASGLDEWPVTELDPVRLAERIAVDVVSDYQSRADRRAQATLEWALWTPDDCADLARALHTEAVQEAHARRLWGCPAWRCVLLALSVDLVRERIDLRDRAARIARWPVVGDIPAETRPVCVAA